MAMGVSVASLSVLFSVLARSASALCVAEEGEGAVDRLRSLEPSWSEGDSEAVDEEEQEAELEEELGAAGACLSVFVSFT